MAKDKEDKPASTRALAVSTFTVPVTAAWLLAVGGIVGWDVPAEELLKNAGGIVAALGGGIAFLTVVLSAVQDIVIVTRKQRLLFPWGGSILHPSRWRYAFPSHWAFSERVMRRAKLTSVPGLDSEGLEILREAPEAQDRRWGRYYQAYRDRPGIVHFSTRHLAWRDTVPVMILLTALTVLLGRLLNWPGRPTLWAYLIEACLVLLAMSWLAGRRSNEALVIAVLERVRDEGETPKTEPKSASAS